MTKTIPSIANKSGKLVSHIVEYDGQRIETSYFRSLNPEIEIYINGELIDTITSNAEKKNIKFSGQEGEHSMEVWFESKEGKFPFFQKAVTGTAITIDDKVVQKTAADPLEQIKGGRGGLMVFSAILVLKLVVVVIQQVNMGSDIPVIAIVSAIYILPLFVLLAFFGLYHKNPKLALIVGLIIAVLESADYIYGTILNFQNGTYTNVYGAASFLLIRMAAVYTMALGLKNVPAYFKSNRQHSSRQRI